MQCFVRFSIPIWLRRLVTVIPSFIVIAKGFDPQTVLVFTQVALSFVLPFALVPLALMCSRKDVMGPLASGWLTTALTWAITLVVLALNVLLLAQTFMVAK